MNYEEKDIDKYYLEKEQKNKEFYSCFGWFFLVCIILGVLFYVINLISAFIR
jgi:hypothetical protein